jgi:hypothetical protein
VLVVQSILGDGDAFHVGRVAEPGQCAERIEVAAAVSAALDGMREALRRAAVHAGRCGELRIEEGERDTGRLLPRRG